MVEAPFVDHSSAVRICASEFVTVILFPTIGSKTKKVCTIE